VQQNVEGSHFFNRSWDEFKVGFNDTRGNYWLGNELLSQLTLNGRYKMRVDLQLRADSSWVYAEYKTFVVYGESQNYLLLVSGFSGNAGDALWYHDRALFSTYDRDNDEWKNRKWNNNCALIRGGGFWYNKACDHCGINTVRGRPGDFRWYSKQHKQRLLQSSRMWLTC